jgi:hypothetical protein
MRCGACQRECRATKLASIAGEDGRIRRGRVCGKCFDGALHIVTRVTVVKKGVDAVTSGRREASDAVSAAAKKLKKLARAYAANPGGGEVQGSPEACSYDGRIEGLEQAVNILEAGDF